MTASEKKTFYLHLIYSFLDGIIVGVLALNEFVLLKSLRASNYEIATLVQFTVILLLFANFINELIKRSRNKKRMLKYMAFFTRLPLLLMFFFPQNANEIANSHYHLLFLGVFFMYYLADPFILPTISLFLKTSYSHQNFGKLYSYASTLNKIVILFATFMFGLLLDFDMFAFRYIYPVIGILGIISVFTLTQIDYHEPENLWVKTKFIDSVKDSFKVMFRILKENLAFSHFQIAFMIYGFVWIGTMAAINIFFDEVLNLNYSSVAFYKNSYNTIAIVILPFFGKIIGKLDPRKFGIYSFASLLLFLLFMLLTEYFPYYITIFGLKIYYLLILSYTFYGIFAATMALLWYIGSAYFCKKEETANYQAVHLTLTGVRGAFAPILGMIVYETFSFTGVFGIGIAMMLASIGVLFYSLKKIPKVVINN